MYNDVNSCPLIKSLLYIRNDARLHIHCPDSHSESHMVTHPFYRCSQRLTHARLLSPGWSHFNAMQFKFQKVSDISIDHAGWLTQLGSNPNSVQSQSWSCDPLQHAATTHSQLCKQKFPFHILHVKRNFYFKAAIRKRGGGGLVNYDQRLKYQHQVIWLFIINADFFFSLSLHYLLVQGARNRKATLAIQQLFK